jgi:hypothetical protein
MEIRPCSYARCGATFNSPEDYARHSRLHDGGKHALIHCPYVSCEKRYVWSDSISRHIRVEHFACQGVVQLQDPEFTFTCTLASCYNATVTTIKDMRLHLLSHTDRKETVSCPFMPCSKSYRIRGSLASHFTRCHKNVTALDVRGIDHEPVLCGSSDPEIPSAACPASPPGLPNSPASTNQISVPLELDFSNALADFYNVCLHEKNVPYSTLDYMIKKLISFQVTRGFLGSA